MKRKHILAVQVFLVHFLEGCGFVSYIQLTLFTRFEYKHLCVNVMDPPVVRKKMMQNMNSAVTWGAEGSVENGCILGEEGETEDPLCHIQIKQRLVEEREVG